MGLAVCKHCGNTYIGQPNRRNSGTIVRRLTHRRPFCGMRPRSLRVEHVMSQFHDRVLPHISLDQDWQDAVLAAMGRPHSAPDQMQRARLERALENLRKQHLWGDVDDQDYQQQRTELERSLKAVNASVGPRSLPDLERAAELLGDLPKLWEHPGVDDRQRETIIGKSWKRQR